MNAEKTFKALVKMARAHNFRVRFFRGGSECEIAGDIYRMSLRINTSCDYETCVNTIVQLLSMFTFFGMNSEYRAIHIGENKGGLCGHVAGFALNIVNAIQAG